MARDKLPHPLLVHVYELQALRSLDEVNCIHSPFQYMSTDLISWLFLGINHWTPIAL
jgi:hypothetical protein